MRKVIMFNLITLDGFFEGLKKWDIDWHQVDQEFDDFSIEQLNQMGGIIFGRVTYEGMADFWQSQTAMENDPVITSLMNSLPKFVFSRTMEHADWNNTRLIKGDAVEELEKLKREPGGDLFIFGSADLCSTFIRQNQIDEFRLMLNPIILGEGKPLFKEEEGMLKLKLLNTRAFNNGNVLLYYSSDEP